MSRIVTAPGVDGRIPLISQCAQRAVFVSITPQPSAALDARGCSLHLLYTIARGAGDTELIERPVQDKATGDQPNTLSIEFDAGNHWLAYGGTLYLTGGAGEYAVEVFEGKGCCSPHWHFLTVGAPLNPGDTLTVPKAYSIVGASRRMTVTVNGFIVELDHDPIPMGGHTITFPGGDRQFIYFGWWG